MAKIGNRIGGGSSDESSSSSDDEERAPNAAQRAVEQDQQRSGGGGSSGGGGGSSGGGGGGDPSPFNGSSNNPRAITETTNSVDEAVTGGFGGGSSDRDSGGSGGSSGSSGDQSGGGQGLEAESSNVGAQARVFEQEVVENSKFVDDPSQVKVTRSGDKLEAAFTESGRKNAEKVVVRRGGIRQKAQAVESDPGREMPGRSVELDHTTRKKVEAARATPEADIAPERRARSNEEAISSISSQMSGVSRAIEEQERDFRDDDIDIDIPFTDETTESAARGYSETVRGGFDKLADAVPDNPTIYTTAGSFKLPSNDLGATLGKSSIRSVGDFAALPGDTAVFLEDSAEFAVEGIDAGLSGEGEEFADDTVRVGGNRGRALAGEFKENPMEMGVRLTGTAALTGGAIGGAKAVGGARAGRAAAVAVQPGEELAFAALRRGGSLTRGIDAPTSGAKAAAAGAKSKLGAIPGKVPVTVEKGPGAVKVGKMEGVDIGTPDLGSIDLSKPSMPSRPNMPSKPSMPSRPDLPSPRAAGRRQLDRADIAKRRAARKLSDLQTDVSYSASAARGLAAEKAGDIKSAPTKAAQSADIKAQRIGRRLGDVESDMKFTASEARGRLRDVKHGAEIKKLRGERKLGELKTDVAFSAGEERAALGEFLSDTRSRGRSTADSPLGRMLDADSDVPSVSMPSTPEISLPSTPEISLPNPTDYRIRIGDRDGTQTVDADELTFPETEADVAFDKFGEDAFDPPGSQGGEGDLFEAGDVEHRTGSGQIQIERIDPAMDAKTDLETRGARTGEARSPDVETRSMRNIAESSVRTETNFSGVDDVTETQFDGVDSDALVPAVSHDAGERLGTEPRQPVELDSRTDIRERPAEIGGERTDFDVGSELTQEVEMEMETEVAQEMEFSAESRRPPVEPSFDFDGENNKRDDRRGFDIDRGEFENPVWSPGEVASGEAFESVDKDIEADFGNLDL